MAEEYDVIILGAGAAGLMAAATAAYRGRRVLVLDHAPKAAAKIRISGGGKCNFTNVSVKASHYICANPHFVKSALARFTQDDFLALVDRHGLVYELREEGRYFCAQRAGDLIAILRQEVSWAGAEVRTGQILTLPQKIPEGFSLRANGQNLQCQSLLVATGALSFPKLKASGFGYTIAEHFGLKTLPRSPGLVPLAFDGRWKTWMAELSGLSFRAQVCVHQQCFTEDMLFTHEGLSGPAILQVSNYWQKGQAIHINLLPQFQALPWFIQGKQQGRRTAKLLAQLFSRRFAQAWLEKYPLDNDLANVPDEVLIPWANRLHAWELYPSDKLGYDKAEVTLGGVDTDEIDSKTLESKKVPGLYFAGEVLDVTGQLGGYNFQWAWASGYAAGLVI